MRGAPRIFLALAAAATLGPGGPPVRAQQAATDRYAMTPADGGFLRLDKETGAVAFCTVEKGETAVCRLAADERAALESEIARLRRENAELRGLASEGVTPPANRELDRVLTLTEKFVRRFMRLFKDAPQGERT